MRPEWALLALSTCGLHTSPDGCPWARTTLVASYIEDAGGTCGPIGWESVPVNYDWSEGGACAGEPTFDPDACTVRGDFDCVEPGADGKRSHQEMTLGRSGNTMQGAFDMQVWLSSGAEACHSIYRATFKVPPE